jgi:hypothetical protein
MPASYTRNVSEARRDPAGTRAEAYFTFSISAMAAAGARTLPSWIT